MNIKRRYALRRMLTALGMALRVRMGRAVAKNALTEETFNRVYHNNRWNGSDSLSGTGSDLVQTAEIRKRLPELIRRLGATSLLDIPCGDFHWMKEVNLDLEYLGADVVEEMIRRNQKLYATEKRRFIIRDIIKDGLPEVDLVLCRDLLVHLSFQDAFAALRNLQRSGSRYLVTTTFTCCGWNIDIDSGWKWRPLDLRKRPFGLGNPILLINENCTEANGKWADKSLGVWVIADLSLPGSR